MDGKANSINWFEIPVSDFDRARKFYSEVFGFDMQEQQMGPNRMGFFPYEPGSGKVSGAIVAGEGYEPTANGPLVYFNGGKDLAEPLGRVEGAGGSIHMPKTEIMPEIGFMAVFTDTEGNRVALHSPPAG